MDRPRLFLSAVSEEFRTARKKIASIVQNLGYDAISQDNFPKGHGELRSWLCEQIDSCEGLIQLVGIAYGAEPPDVDTDYGRVSYTQFEFLYARVKRIKTWVIVVEENCHRDKAIDLLDFPSEPNHPTPTEYQADRKKLQENYIALLSEKNHLRHYAKSDEDLELKIYKLRDELSELRQHWEKWLKRDNEFKINTTQRLDELGEASRLTTEKIRVHLLETAEITYRRELAESEIPKDWRERQRLREAATNSHTARLLRIDDLAAAFAEIEGRGLTTIISKEMTRILSEQGVDEAIAYVATQRPKILASIRARSAALHERNRIELRPLLLTAGMYETKAEFTKAYDLYIEILAIETNWIRPRNNLAWTLIQWKAIIKPEKAQDKLKEAVDICLETIELSKKEKKGEYWAEAQYYLGRAIREQGIRTDDKASVELLSHAVKAYRRALTVRTRKNLPKDWAETQNNLGNALSDQGIRKGGKAGAELLAQAVRAYREALIVRTRILWPQQWAVTKNNMGVALSEQGYCTGGKAGAELLAQAVTAFREALTVYTRESMPQEWANTQNNLGNEFSNHGIRTGGKAGVELLAQAVTAFRNALTVYTRESMPQKWAEIQNNLGNALLEQGYCTGDKPGAELFAQAVTAYRQALTVYTRESQPQDWADTQNILGNALLEQGYCTGGKAGVELLAQAVTAFRNALTGYTRESMPQEWAEIQNNSGNALSEQGICTGGKAGAELLAQAVTAYRQALTVYTRESQPQDWADTQNNIGVSLSELGICTGGEAGAKYLFQAVTAYREALTVNTRGSIPQNWAITQKNLGDALFELGQVEKSIDLLIQSKAMIQSSYSFFKESGYSHNNQYFDEKLEDIENEIKELS